jgi:hypothetical protein
VEEPRKHRGVAFGGHAAVIVQSDVAGNPIRQEAFASISKAHARIVRPDFGCRGKCRRSGGQQRPSATLSRLTGGGCPLQRIAFADDTVGEDVRA